MIIWKIDNYNVEKVTKLTNKLYANARATTQYGLITDDFPPTDVVFINLTRNDKTFHYKMDYGRINLEDGTEVNGWYVTSNGDELNVDLNSGMLEMNVSFNIKRFTSIDLNTLVADYTTETDVVYIYPSGRYTPQAEANDAELIYNDLNAKQNKADTLLNTEDKTVVGAINENRTNLAQERTDRINNINELSGYTQGLVNELRSEKQNVSDDLLATTAKTVVGAINEVLLKTDDEIINRESAINGIQTQIDTLEQVTNVADVVGSYEDLLNYDTEKLTENDIVEVLSDETYNNADTYYRWKNNDWIFIGSLGSYYTKSESDSLLNEKTSFEYVDNAIQTAIQNTWEASY